MKAYTSKKEKKKVEETEDGEALEEPEGWCLSGLPRAPTLHPGIPSPREAMLPNCQHQMQDVCKSCGSLFLFFPFLFHFIFL